MADTFPQESGYSQADRERFVPEQRETPIRRSEFARDRARVLHSSALRRLGAKTQVLSPSGGDFARTRLTHSLEVAQVGREMASDLGLSPDLVDMACLAHDLGHPPFGHNGEKALNDWAQDIGGFEGNAQTLRLLSRIEPKVFADSGASAGLNLTRASLDAACKYPWQRSTGQIIGAIDASVKFGVYEDDLAVFEWLRIGSEPLAKCVEAQVMDFADDVAYSVHDFEDAVVAGFIKVEELNDPNALQDLTKKIISWGDSVFSSDSIVQAFSRLRASVYWPTSFEGSSRDLASLKNLTSAFISSFVRRTTEATIAEATVEFVTRYNAKVNVPEEVRTEIAVLKGIVSAFLMSHESRRPFYEWQRALLVELADALLAGNGQNLDPASSSAWLDATTEIARKRVIVDQVASLTDQSALNLHNQLVNRTA